MFKIIQICSVCILLSGLWSHGAAAAWPWSDTERLVTINGIDYSQDEFKRWWRLWNEEKGRLPDDPQPFIEWKLLAQEARSMELDQLASFRRKLEVYLKSRTRMLLKRDEVDSKVQKVSEADIRSRYDEDYSPLRLGFSLYFDSMEKAEAASGKILEGELSIDELLQLKPNEGGVMFKEGQVIRPRDLRAGLSPVALAAGNLEAGEVSAPVASGHVFLIFFLKELISFNEDDYAKNREGIRSDLLQESRAMLTASLLAELKKKYDVRVDEELLTRVDTGLSGEILKRPIAITLNGDIPLYPLIKDLRVEERIRKGKLEGEDLKRARQGLLEGMIADYLITWESLGRHYEEKPPFKWSYEFYQENRLIRELENLVLRKMISVSETEIEEYYQSHPDRFLGPRIVSIARLEDDRDIIENIRDEIGIGQDFFKVAKKYYTQVIPVNEVNLDELSPAWKKAVENLSVGEVSTPIELENKYGLVKLIQNRPPEPKPLSSSVRKEIGNRVYQEKYSARRQAYLEELLAQSQIDLSKRSWEKIKKEMASN